MPATLTDLMNTEGRAELINGEIVQLPLDGAAVGQANGAILYSLHHYSKQTRVGCPFSTTVAFVVDLPHRQSISPSASYYVGPSAGMGFPIGAPMFAVETRNLQDYGPQVEIERAAKRADYFAAGTRVVWDVDLLGSDAVKKYTAENPDTPIIFRQGETADAEPAVPGWTLILADEFARQERD